MSTTEIRQKLHQYIESAEDKKVKAIYTMVENEIELAEHWQDETFVNEINRRTDELETGKVKGYTWQQVKSRAKKS